MLVLDPKVLEKCLICNYEWFLFINLTGSDSFNGILDIFVVMDSVDLYMAQSL